MEARQRAATDQFFARVAEYADFDEGARDAWCALLAWRDYRKGELLVAQGQQTHQVMFLLSIYGLK